MTIASSLFRMPDFTRSCIFLIAVLSIGSGAVHGALSIEAKDVVSGGYSYELGWDGMIPEPAGKTAARPGTFFGDVATSFGVSISHDSANGVRTLNIKPGVTSAGFEYKFDFSRTGRRVVGMTVRDVLRLEPEPGNWAVIKVLWRAGEVGSWKELRALNGTKFAAPDPLISEVVLPEAAAVVYYRVEFISEKPVAYKWGRARWNFLKKASSEKSAFRVDFTLSTVTTVSEAGPVAEGSGSRVALPNGNSPWGISAHPLRDTEWAHLDTLVERVGQAGMVWLREDFSFPRILTRDGQRDYSKFDTLVDKLSRAGVGTVGILNAYDNDLRKKGYGDAVPIHRHPEVWREYVKSMVGRYHDRVKHWVVWNEQDGGFWGGTPNAEEYVVLLKIAHEQIKAIDPEAKVVTGGLVYWNVNYMRAMYRAGAAGYFDVVGMHRYGPGPDGDATTVRTMREFRALMAEHGQANVPVWILESGGSTFRSPLLVRQPLFMDKSVRVSLARLGRPVAEGAPLRAGVVVSPRTGRVDEVVTTRAWLPGTALTPITLDALRQLDPAECPVLVSDAGLHIDEPLLEPLRAYVERGGLLVAAGHPPFYVLHTRDADGIWQSRDAVGEVYSFFRMGFVASWNTKGVPEHTEDVFVPAEAAAAGVPPVGGVYVKHFFNTKNQKPGDGYLPLLSARDKKGQTFADPIALYTYGDAKGGVLACSASLAGGWTEEEQARMIPRIYLSYLGTPESGVEKIFIYDLHDDGQNPGEREHNFGLVRWDWSPKPAFGSYREMVNALGKAPEFVRRLPGGAESDWALVFRRAEDNGLVLAAWSVEPDRRFGVSQAAGEVFWHSEGATVAYLPLAAGMDAHHLVVRPKS